MSRPLLVVVNLDLMDNHQQVWGLKKSDDCPPPCPFPALLDVDEIHSGFLAQELAEALAARKHLTFCTAAGLLASAHL